MSPAQMLDGFCTPLDAGLVKLGRWWQVDHFRAAIGSFCVLTGLIMLMAPHRLAQLVALAPLQPFFFETGALFLVCGILMIVAAVLRLSCRRCLAIHMVTAAALLLVAIGYILSRTWTGAIAFGVLAGATALTPWLATPRGPDQSTEDAPLPLLPFVLAIISLLTGVSMLATPREFDAPNFTALRPWLLPIGLADIVGGAALLAVYMRPVSLLVRRVVSLMAGAGIAAYVLLAPLPNGNLIGLAYFVTIWLPLPIVCWQPARGCSPRTTSLSAMLALTLSLAAATPLVLTFVAKHASLPAQAELHAYREEMLVYLLAAVLAAVLGGILLGRRLARPLVTLAAAAEQFARGGIVPLSGSGITEADRLAAAFGDMRARLAARTAERQQAEAALHALNQALEDRVRERTAALTEAISEAERLAAIVSAANEAIFRTTPQGIITDWNHGAARLTGVEAELAIGRHVSFLCASEHVASMLEIVTRLEAGDRIEHMEMEWRRPDGQSISVSASVSPILDAQGRVVGAGVIAQDITAKREADQQRLAMARTEKLRVVGQMASGIAHDLNQSLALISGYSELVRDVVRHGEAANTDIDDMLHVIARAAREGGETVGRLLRFARGRGEGTRAAFHVVDVAGLLADVAQLTAPRWQDTVQAEGRPIRLEVSAAAGIGVMGAQASLREALTNLIFNAVDAMPRGGTIHLTARRRNGRVTIAVADEGEGMSPETVERAFEPFFTTKGERGTGLGLPMVQTIVHDHGGTLAVRSTVGVGTTFSLEFPAVTLSAPSPTPVAALAAAPDEPALAASLHILVVDDKQGITEMAAMMLTSFGHVVRTALSGEDAIAQLEASPFDVVVSDVAMGDGINGWQLASQIRERWPTCRVILATGWGAGIDLVEARWKGVTNVLAKPYRAKELNAAVISACAG